MLPGKWYADDRDKQQGGENQVHKSRIQPSAEQPHDIGKQGQAPCAAGLRNDLFAEGPQYDACQFKTLQAPGQPDDGDAQYKPAEEIAQCGPEAA